jgi:diguanylate cyclase (GGDEF)-like protein
MDSTDPLTGLANRRKATEALERLFSLAGRNGVPVSVAILDLDHFKQVNDQHGHAAGDTVLRRLGELLTQSFRTEDVTARWGGEEFLVGMYGSTKADGARRLTALLQGLRGESFAGDGGESFTVTFSAGVAEHAADCSDLEALCRAADEALYQAKAAGRARVMGVQR